LQGNGFSSLFSSLRFRINRERYIIYPKECRMPALSDDVISHRVICFDQCISRTVVLLVILNRTGQTINILRINHHNDAELIKTACSLGHSHEDKKLFYQDLRTLKA